MKIERLQRAGEIWPWLLRRLPPSLVPRERCIGYGIALFIYQRGNEPRLMERLFEDRGDPVAQVYGIEVHVYHPQYFSDFEDLCRRFESETGREPTLKYWEAPLVEA